MTRITIERETLERAIDALQWHYDRGYPDQPTDEPRKRDARTIRTLRAALAQKAEPDEQEVALQKIADFGQDQVMTPDVLISKLANLRAMAAGRNVPEVDLATIDLAIEHLRFFSVTPWKCNGPHMTDDLPLPTEEIAAYWDIAYAEGDRNARYDTSDGSAQSALQDLQEAIRAYGDARAAAAVAQERERCAKLCESMRPVMLPEPRPPNEDVERGYSAGLRRAADAIRAGS